VNVFDRIKEKEAESKARNDQRIGWALEQGLVLVQVTPRRYEVLKLNKPSGGYGLRSKQNAYITYMTGEVVFGPANYDACCDYIAAEGTPLPPDLIGV
jgi:hypothetical protein